MATVTNKLSELLRTELNERGWSQRELARRAGISHTMISEVISEVRIPGWDFCAAIAKPLGKTQVEIFRLAGLLPASIGTVDDLDGEESELVQLWRRLPSGPDQEYLLRLVRAWVKDVEEAD